MLAAERDKSGRDKLTAGCKSSTKWPSVFKLDLITVLCTDWALCVLVIVISCPGAWFDSTRGSGTIGSKSREEESTLNWFEVAWTVAS